MKTVKTANGKLIDMSAIAAQHQTERAVSNVPINAKGDIIDNRGNVKVTREEIKKQYYKNSVPGIEEQTSIKQDSTDVLDAYNDDRLSTRKDVEVPLEEGPVEISRTERARKDGTKYYEVEYSDGSMEEVNIDE
jgi:hypothetical protein